MEALRAAGRLRRLREGLREREIAHGGVELVGDRLR